MAEDAEERDADCFYEAAAVGEELCADDMEEGAVFKERGCGGEARLRDLLGVVQEHAEAAVGVEDAAHHEAVAGFEDVEESGHGGERDGADEEGEVEVRGGGGFFGCEEDAARGEEGGPEAGEEGGEPLVGGVLGGGYGVGEVKEAAADWAVRGVV